MSAPYIVPFNHEPASNISTGTSYTVPAGSYVKLHVFNASYAGNQNKTANTSFDVNHLDMARIGDAPIVRSITMQTILFRDGVGNVRMRYTHNTRLLNIRNLILKADAIPTNSTLTITCETSGSALNVFDEVRAASDPAYFVNIEGIATNLISFFFNVTSVPREVAVLMAMTLADYGAAHPVNMRAGEIITVPTFNSVNLYIERFNSLT